MKKLRVNKDACIGCGLCVSTDSEHFDFDDNVSEVISQENIDSREVKIAMESCPTNAIYYEEDAEENHEKCENCNSKDCCKNKEAGEN